MKMTRLWPLFVFATCAPQGTPGLELTLSPEYTSGPLPIHVRAVATKADGTLGTGTVTFTSDKGSLAASSVPLDAYGTASTELVCDPAADPGCAALFQVSATWPVNGKVTYAEARLNRGGAGGGSGGTGGGAGGGFGTSGLFTSGRVLLLGTIAPGSCGRDSIGDPRTPTSLMVAFPCYIDEQTAIISGGQLYYRDGLPGMRRFHQDSWDRAGTGTAYPSPDKVMDDHLYDSCGEFSFRISRTGRILHGCPTLGPGWYIDDQPAPWVPTSSVVYAFGDDDSVLLDTGVMSADGGINPFSPSNTGPYGGPSLPIPGGFLFTQLAASSTCDLFKVTLDGTTTRLGGYPVPCNGKIDANGTMSFFITQSSDDAITEVPLDGGPSVIYTEANSPPEDFTVYPPKVYNQIHISSLVSGN